MPPDSVPLRQDQSSEAAAARADSALAALEAGFELPAYMQRDTLRDAALRRVYYEDFAELVSGWPGVRISRSGDVGQLTQAGLHGLPPRFTRLFLDGLPWPQDIYGQTNLTLVPETAADQAIVSADGIALYSLPIRTQVMRTLVQYANGPQGSDATRVRVRRALSGKMAMYLSGAFANADGQVDAITNLELSEPYEGIRLDNRFEYKLQNNLYLHYRLLTADNETGVSAPLFFEDQPLVGRTVLTEKRVLHALELRRYIGRLAMAPAPAAPARWHLRLYHWDMRQAFDDRTLSRSRAHAMKYFGAAVHWQKIHKRYALAVGGRFEHEKFSSRTLQIGSQNVAETVAHLRWNPAGGLIIAWSGDLGFRQRFDPGAGMRLHGELQVVRGIRLRAGIDSRAVFPEPGEFANLLPGILAANPQLQTFRQSSAEIGVRWQRGKFRGHFHAHAFVLQDFPRLAVADTVVHFVNSQESETGEALQIAVHWQALQNIRVRLVSDLGLRRRNELYLWWHHPRQTGRVELSWSHRFFQRDLQVDVLLRGRYIGERTVLSAWQTKGLPPLERAPHSLRMDAMLRIHFKDALVFISFDNIFNREDDWRPQQPMRPFLVRWGIYWLFKD